MKKHFLLKLFLLVFLSASISLKSQKAQTYSFLSTSATYSPLTGGNIIFSPTILPLSGIDTSNIPIGFTFNYLGKNFNTLNVSISGGLKFGKKVDAATTLITWFGQMFSDPSVLQADTVFSAFGDNLNIYSNTEVRYQTIGSAPNRTFVVQWKDADWIGTFGLQDLINFQMKLFETTNKLQAHYGNCYMEPSFFNPANESGLRGCGGAADFKGLECYLQTGPSSWATPAVYSFTNAPGYPCIWDGLGSIPANGQQHTWSPPNPCSGTPPGGTARIYDFAPNDAGGWLQSGQQTSNMFTIPACDNFPVFLTLVNQPAVSGLGFQWQLSTNNATWAAIPNATNPSYYDTLNLSVNTWYRCITSCGSNTAASVAAKVTVDPLSANLITAMPSMSVCAGTTVNLTFSPLLGSSVTCNWLSSSNNSTWAAIPSATNQSYSSAISNPIYYSAILGCGTSTLQAASKFIPTYTTPLVGGITAASFTSACANGQLLNLSVNGSVNSSTVAGLQYQWQTSPNGVSYTNATATNVAYPTSFVNTLYYRRVIGCGASSATSTPVQVINTGSPIVYAAVPFLENFDNTWANRCDNQNVPNANNWGSIPATGNSAWRRQDAGSTALWTNPTTGTIAPLAGAGCANFHSSQYADGSLLLHLNTVPGTNYLLSFYYVNPNSDDGLQVSISQNGGASFSSIYDNIYGYNLTYGNVTGIQPSLGAWNKWYYTLPAITTNSLIIKLNGTSDVWGSSSGPSIEDFAIDSLEFKPCAPQPSNILASSNPFCAGNSATLTTNGKSATYQIWTNTTIGTYSWNIGANTQSIAVTPTTSTFYSVTYTNVVGCKSSVTQSVQLIVNPSPGALVSNPTSICPGGSATLSLPSAVAGYTWSNGSNANSIIVTPTVGTLYSLTAITAQGCSNTQSVVVGINVPPSITILGLNSVCANSALTLNGFGATSYTWQPGAQTGSVAVITPSASGIYTLTGFNGLCNGIATKSITALPLPNINVTQTQSICLPTSGVITLTANTTGTSYTWQPSGISNANINVTPSNSVSTTIYSVTAISAQLCVNSVTTAIVVESCAGINENYGNIFNVNIYPNPSNNVLNIRSTNDLNGTNVSIYNNLGMMVKSLPYSEIQGVVNISDLSNGLYHLVILNNLDKQVMFKQTIIKN
jgi:hypothetical protein